MQTVSYSASQCASHCHLLIISPSILSYLYNPFLVSILQSMAMSVGIFEREKFSMVALIGIWFFGSLEHFNYHD